MAVSQRRPPKFLEVTNYMKKRMLSMFLALLTICGLIPTTAFAAPTLDEAMAEVDIYSKDQDIVYLTANGKVQNQKYIYYNYTSVITGETKEIPAYCVDPRLYGVPETVSEGTPIKYSSNETVSDPKVCGIISNGYPHWSLAQLGLQSVEEAYYATKTALWCYILSGSWSIDRLGINPALSGADREAAERVLEATKQIYTRGMAWNKLVSPKLTATADRATAYPVTIDGEDYLQQVFTITSETWAYETVKLSLSGEVPSGTKIVDMNNREIDRVTVNTGGPDGYQEKIKIIYPVSSVEGQSGNVKLDMETVVSNYAIYYAVSLEKDKYGNIQDYMLDTDPHISMEGSAISSFAAQTGDDDNEEEGKTVLKIVKQEAGTETPLEGAVFKVTNPEGSTLGHFSTGADGTVSIPVTLTGHYTVEETVPPEWHLLDEESTRHVQVVHGKTSIVTFANEPYGNLRVEKYSNTGEPLEGVTIQVKHLQSGATQSGQTSQAGVVEFTDLKPGGYEVRETAGIPGWIAETDTVQTVSVTTGETSTVTFTNKELPGLRIVKYDRTTLKAMADVSFEIWRDGELLGTYQTDALGEIVLTDQQPGTYLVKEVASDDEHIVDTTPQQVELHAGDGIKQLVFFNDRKPGIHLIKVDSADLSKPIANAKFEIKAVDGSYGPEEFTTDENGEIDLSKLPVGAYVVTELECPGYVIDKAQRLIQLDGNENAQFVFTNTIKPSIQIVKLSSDGSRLSGVTFRISKIEDGSHYLDRTTNAQGEVLISDLEPGVYSVKETATVADHIMDPTEYHVELFPGKTSTLVVENQKRPNLIVYKHDADTGEPVPNTVFLVEAADGHSVDEIKTDSSGKTELKNLLPGVYEITEKSVPAPYLQDAPSQLVTLYPNRDHTVYFENHKKPNLTVHKVDSITGEPIEGAKFQVWYASNSTASGELNDLGFFYSDENGQFTIDAIRDGWYKVTELEPAAGYAIKDPATQEVYIKGGESKVLTFENTPLSALVVWKYDSVTGEAVEGAVFQVKYLGGTSGSGGTVIGTYKTGVNGSFTVTGLEAGTYIVEELASDSGHVIDTAPQTAYISGKEQDVVQLYFGNSPKGALLVKKIDSETHNPLSDVEFMVTTSDGTVVGDANGKFVTDSAGTILIEGIDPGTTLVVKETRAKDGYELDDTPQTATIKAGQTVTLEFRNTPQGCLLITKVDSVTGKPLSGVQFKIAGCNGCEYPAGTYTTDANGQIKLSHIPSGCYSITETKAAEGYLLNGAAQTVKVESGSCKEVTIANEPLGGLVIKKMDSVTKEPLSEVIFKVTTADGAVVGTSNGEFRTDENGYITIPDLEPGGYVVQEVKAREGYLLDNTPKTIQIKDHQTYTLEFFNQPKGSLIINKLDSVTKAPLEGVEFELTYSDGSYVDAEGGALSSKGLYTTDENGQIILSGLTGTIVVTETRTIEGYTIHEETRTQTVVINSGDTQELTFYNDPVGGVEIIKVDAADKTQRLANATFEIRKMDDALVDTVTTDQNGRVFLSLEDGAYYAVEIEAPEGYKLDDTPYYFEVVEGKTSKLTITNRALSGILIHKTDSTTGEGIYGVSFLLYGSSNTPIGQYTSDDRGYVYIEDLEAGRYYLRELENEGYVPDTQKKTVYVKSGETTEVEWENTPITGQIQITKTSADYNSINGWPAGTPIPNTVFEIYHYRTGKLVETIKTDKNGVAVSKPLPLGRYKIVESQAAEFYGLDKTPIEVEIEYAGQIVKTAMTNKSLYTNVSIKKTGYAEVMPGQSIRYNFSGIANNSTTSLTSFYWRDTLPTQAVRLDQIITGTYNVAGNYKVVYQTNLSGGTWRTMYDNLSTMQSYTLDASPTALGLASNEYVTAFMVSFGVVPANFRQVEAPRVYCNVVSWLTGGAQFVNQVDAGGVYDGQWIMATSRWVTKVYKPSEPLPKTGY